MAQKFIIASLFCLWTICGFGQSEEGATGPLRDQIRARRVAIYTDVLKLTSSEAQNFWPVFNQYLDDRESLTRQYKPLKSGNLSDAEAEDAIRKHLEKQQKELDLERELIQKLRKVITLQQIARIPEAEKQFRKNVLVEAKERRANAPARKRGGRR